MKYTWLGDTRRKTCTRTCAVTTTRWRTSGQEGTGHRHMQRNRRPQEVPREVPREVHGRYTGGTTGGTRKVPREVHGRYHVRTSTRKIKLTNWKTIWHWKASVQSRTDVDTYVSSKSYHQLTMFINKCIPTYSDLQYTLYSLQYAV